MLNKPMRFRAPAIPNESEVRNYIELEGLNVNPAAFIDYYGARGWHISPRMPLMDWKAMVRQWNRTGYSAKAKDVGAPLAQFASLGALQIQLKRVEDELSEILYKGGAAYKTEPLGNDRIRYDALMLQRASLKARLNKF